MKQIGSQKSRTGARARARLAGGARQAAGGENLVAEIVDQITRKQSRVAGSTQPRRSTAGTCAFCLDEAVAASPYRLVLKCEAEEGPPSDH